MMGFCSAPQVPRIPYTAKREVVDPTERFVQSLQSRLFSGLARQVEDSIFGDDPQGQRYLHGRRSAGEL